MKWDSGPKAVPVSCPWGLEFTGEQKVKVGPRCLTGISRSGPKAYISGLWTGRQGCGEDSCLLPTSYGPKRFEPVRKYFWTVLFPLVKITDAKRFEVTILYKSNSNSASQNYRRYSHQQVVY